MPALTDLSPLEQGSVDYGLWAKPKAENGFYIFSGSFSTHIISLILPLGPQNLKIYHLTIYKNSLQSPALEGVVAGNFQNNFLLRGLTSLCVLVICVCVTAFFSVG